MKHSTFSKALGKIVSGLYLVTHELENKPVVMLASWVMQTSFDPPMISLCVGRDRAIREQMIPGRHFGLNVIGDQHKHLMKTAYASHPDPLKPFGDLPTQKSIHGCIMLTHASAFLDCRVERLISAGDHDLVLAELVDGQVLRDDRPMTHIRKNGLHY
ncbi:MAG: flavin reductase family protein [Bdellovibrionales bacterium]|nr:flavin reductase family protein [Bdellovibrionales bacterium]